MRSVGTYSDGNEEVLYWNSSGEESLLESRNIGEEEAEAKGTQRGRDCVAVARRLFKEGRVLEDRDRSRSGREEVTNDLHDNLQYREVKIR